MRNDFNVNGNIGRIDSIKEIAGGKKVINFTIAESIAKDKSQWWNCTAFDKSAELISQYYSKGDNVSLQGWLQQQEYEKDGVKKLSYSLVVNNFSFPVKRSGVATEQATTSPSAQSPAQDESDNLPF